MGVEIERKFLINSTEWRKRVSKATELKQGYLNSHSERTVRIRTNGEIGKITIKGKTEGFTRKEYEYEIPVQDAEDLLKLCEEPIIEKIRHIVVHKNKTWEVDEFDGLNQGLVVAEIELENENEIVELPDWIGEEVTDEPRYYNSNLASKPYSEWSREK